MIEIDSSGGFVDKCLQGLLLFYVFLLFANFTTSIMKAKSLTFTFWRNLT
nr:MAG TPA: hypothetical protein [Caudoviricetes sp.]